MFDLLMKDFKDTKERSKSLTEINDRFPSQQSEQSIQLQEKKNA